MPARAAVFASRREDRAVVATPRRADGGAEAVGEVERFSEAVELGLGAGEVVLLGGEDALEEHPGGGIVGGSSCRLVVDPGLRAAGEAGGAS